jgi:hypothetical protein
VTAEIDSRPSVRRLRHRPGATIREPVAVPVETELQARIETAIEASAADLRVLFEEAAAALVRMTARPEASGPACRWETVTLRAPDVPGLAGLWLDRLIALGDQRFSDERREAVVMVAVDRVASPEEDAVYGRWTLRARVGLRPYRETGPQRTPEVRSASDRPLAVERDAGAWTLRARLAF